jgi:glycosyltransferase involved in cell wall biosynthesis
MNATPRVTVIIPTYNRSNILPYAIGSVLWQSFPDFELLVVGDGCTDDSEGVVASMNDGRVQWINLPSNTGHQSAPNNEGLRQARGELVAYLGHDDLWLPHHLSCMVSALDAGADVAYGVLERIFPDDGPRIPAGFRYAPGDWLPPSGVAHRRRVTQTVGGWRDYRTLITDPESDLWLRAYESGCRFEFVPRLTVLKFPASKRPGVYRDRPSHEQAEWYEKIQNEQDLEARELTGMLGAQIRAAHVDAWNQQPYGVLIRELAVDTRKRIRNKLYRMLRRTPPPAPAPFAKGEMIELNRLRKGLHPNI